MATGPIENSTPMQKKVFVLCFDGTGNKFSGTDADSNILKLYRMLDRSDANIYTFYQPGIGTYITSHSMQTTTMMGRVRSWYMKSKDSAVGSSFAEHVMGGYKFLMRYYSCEDDLYFFGFSRGAYTARFLAEMLDHVGLLTAGNEELIRFAWKTYAKWASRKNDGSPAARKEETDLYDFMRGFRETFARPVRRIRFLGLFDTVNSVPKFESAWMQRSKFPYTARSSAKVIRHAVSIDERRAKFRQDLISGDQPQREDHMNSNLHRYNSDLARMDLGFQRGVHVDRESGQPIDRMQPVSADHEVADAKDSYKTASEYPNDLNEKVRTQYLDLANRSSVQQSNKNLARSKDPGYTNDAPLGRKRTIIIAGPVSRDSEDLHKEELPPERSSQNTSRRRGRRVRRRQYSQFNKSQDIEEVWFAGGHADIGGGWSKTDGEHWMLSHAPLVWMVQEAEKAGLEFDPVKMGRHSCHGDRVNDLGERIKCGEASQRYYSAFKYSYNHGVIHDCLAVGNGLPAGTVTFWKLMEYLPFRRMDLQPDGSWKAIRWPLPMGETRDIPLNAQIHHSVIRRMECNPDYRPGNLIIGGGGRGVRKASKRFGIGEWEVYKYQGDPILETYRRKYMFKQE